MLKYKLGSVVSVLGVAAWVCACSSSGSPAPNPPATGGGSATGGSGASATGGGGASATGGTSPGGGASGAGGSATGGASGSSAGGTAGTGGASGSSAGGASGSGGSGGAPLTLMDACTKNCALAAMGVKDMNAMATCDSTPDVCVQNCMTTFTNTSMVNQSLGNLYTEMMVCVATHAMDLPLVYESQISTHGSNTFTTSADFVCSKPASGASVPALNKWSPGPMSDCEQIICDWNCMDGTPGNRDAFIDIRCSCSSV